MTSMEQAVFDQWLEQYATEEELTLPYEKQVEAHIMWLCSVEGVDLHNIPTGELIEN